MTVSKIILMFAVTVAAVGLGCGGTDTTNVNVSTKGAANNANVPPAGVISNSGATPITQSDVNASAGPAAPLAGGESNTNSAQSDLEARRNRKIVDTPGTSLPPTPIPAAENSSIVSIMDNSGVAIETRTFRGDRYINKVEKIHEGTKQTVRIHLKSGKAVTVDAKNVPQIGAITLAQLKQLAGIESAAPAAGDTGSKGTETGGKKR